MVRPVLSAFAVLVALAAPGHAAPLSARIANAVSYTHLTLPTKRIV